ncbi:hypothetical protein DH2020_003963 [Rehmannia glutinosa]|uniref:Reverse transcriptase Ty1/copia-type domain-containing protein n=1 Tax=Rehmannia glutinosa TaxID=99300 RepID=A0ABR0XN81_REHGL
MINLHILLAYSCFKNFKLYQMDVKSAFLNGIIQEEIYVKQPPGFENFSRPNDVYKLKKALYGLKQAPRTWYDRLSSFLLQNSFTRGKVDTTLFVFHSAGKVLLVLVYVDDILITGDDQTKITEVINTLDSRFSLKNLGEVSYFLGLEAHRIPSGILLNQAKYITDLLTKASMENCNSCPTPCCPSIKLSLNDSPSFEKPSLYRSLVGALQYLTMTRPNISYAVNKLSQFLHSPTINHWKACKRVLRFLHGTCHIGLLFKPISRMMLEGFADVDWASSIDDRRSTSGYYVYLGGNFIIWSSKKQHVVARTAEAEYISAAFCCTQLLWMKQTLADYKCSFENVPIFCDNISAINIAQNPVHHNRTKHIEIRHHFLRDCVSKRKIEICFVPSQDQLADIFTKPLSSKTFASIRARLGIMHIK